jgi:hypothetical protein
VQAKLFSNNVAAVKTANHNINNLKIGKAELTEKVCINCRSYGVDGHPSATTQQGNLDKQWDKRSIWR